MKGKKLVVALMAFALVCSGVGLGIHLMHKDADADENHTIKIRCGECGDMDGWVQMEVYDGDSWESNNGETGGDGSITFPMLHAGKDHWHAIMVILPEDHNLGANPSYVDVFYEDHGYEFIVFCDL